MPSRPIVPFLESHERIVLMSMWLRTLAGAYAGQIRDYSMDAGFKALRSGTAERIAAPSPPVAVASAPVTVEKKRKGRPAVETTAAKR